MKTLHNTARVVLQVTESDKEALSELARKEKLSVSSYVRTKFLKNIINE